MALLSSLTRVSSPFLCLKTLSPLQADLIKSVALAAMLADHVNSILLGGSSEILYAFGHAAFPIFTLFWAVNLPSEPHILRQRTRRLWLWAILTQPLFWLAFMMQGQSWLALNILFAYAGCTQLVSWATRWGINGAMVGDNVVAADGVAFDSRKLRHSRSGILSFMLGGAVHFRVG